MERIVVVFSVLALSCGCGRGGLDDPTDLAEGTRLIYDLDTSLCESLAGEEEAIASTRRSVADRLDRYGIRAGRVRTKGSILEVQIPGAAGDADLARGLIEPSGELEFAIVAPDEEQTAVRIGEVQAAEAKHLESLRAWVAAKRSHEARLRAEGEKAPPFPDPRPIAPDRAARPVDPACRQRTPGGGPEGNGMVVVLAGEGTCVSGRHLRDCAATYDESGRPAVAFRFDVEGANRFAAMTGANKGRLLAIVLDGRIVEKAEIKSRIHDRGQLTGNFSQADVRRIVTCLQSGSLPLRPVFRSQERIGPR